MMTPYRLIGFDLGSVLIDIDFNKTMEYYSSVSGISPETLLSRIDMNIPEHFAFERGEIPPNRFREVFSSMAGYPFTEKSFLHGWNAMIRDLRPGMHELLKKLGSKGLLLSMVSNTNIVHEAYAKKKFSKTLTRFDSLIFSHRVGARKPEPEIYRAMLSSVGTPVEPQETLFLDDRQDNVEGAKALGMDAECVDSMEGILEALSRRGIL